MALGISYEIAVVKTPKWFAREESLVDVGAFLLCWLLGMVVLNTWAFLAFFSVFTKSFWTNIGNGILEPPVDEIGPADPPRNDGNGRNRDGDIFEEAGEVVGAPYRGWQGKGGRVARFFNIWRAVFLEWEWERVDKTSLLEEFARPAARQIASALVGSSLSFQFSLFMVPLIARFEQGGIVGKYHSKSRLCQ
jgi:hypothetical protein